ncbi:MAG: type II secretion system protein [Aeoliella sp.]
MKKKSGFTLVELVVVIMILGILAGVAAPKFLSTSADATDNGLRQTLAIIRDAIELYAAQNAGSLPPCTGDGTTDFHPAVEQYLRGTFPASPVGTKDNLITVTSGATTTADDTTGWMFNTTDGTFIINETSASASGTGNYDTF